MIFQNDLNELENTRLQLQRLKLLERHLRDRLLQGYEDDEPVEDGPLGLTVADVDSKRFTQGAVKQVLSPQLFSEVYDNIAPTKYQIVKVTKA